MNTIATYYELVFDIEVSDYRLTLLENDSKNQNDFIDETKTNQSLREKLASLEPLLFETNINADKIRAGYIHITQGILYALSKIEKWGNAYPDLNQGMTIRGYLFGQILNDYKTSLTTEGNYYPVAQIYMSKKEWPAIDLQQFLNQINQDLNNIKFYCKMDAIKFYNRIRNEFHRQLSILTEFRLL